MRSVVRWGLYALAGLVALLVAGMGAGWAMAESRLAKTYTFPVASLTLPTDPAEVARGEHLARTIGQCTGCHGPDLGGATDTEIPLIVAIHGPNLTSGKGGVTAGFSVDDWVRVLRHGVKPDGHPIILMPLASLQAITDTDIAAIIAWARSVPPVDRDMAPATIGPAGRMLWVLGVSPMAEVETLDHTKKPAPSAARGATVAYGEYLAKTIDCAGCHQADLGGGPMPGAPPGMVEPANLTSSGPTASWSEAQFVQFMRSGQTPDGRQVDPLMPWKSIGQLDDDELEALFLFLHAQPAAVRGS